MSRTSRKKFVVVVHYPISDERTAAIPTIEYPSDCYTVGEYASFQAARKSCRKRNRDLGGSAYAAIVDLCRSTQLAPNQYGRYEGYE